MALLTKHLIRARMQRIAPYVAGDVLDLGCGGAEVLKHFGHKIDTYCGIEYSESAVDALRAAYPQASFLARNLDRDELALGKQYDCVLMVALIEHLFNQQHVMSQVAAALKPNGKVVLTTPTPFGNDVVHRLGARLGLFSKAAVDDHIVIYNQHRLKLMARETGLRLSAYRRFQLGCNQFAVLTRA
jgi:2-polyprenyl-3-methyl-5-hydroxy-6-metoxy-1,4-benzoquinol methylase